MKKVNQQLFLIKNGIKNVDKMQEIKVNCYDKMWQIEKFLTLI